MKLVISYQFLCAEHEYVIQIAKIAVVFFVITIWKKLNLHHEMLGNTKGPSIKYVTLEGVEGVREGVTVCDRGDGGQEHVTSRLYKFLSYV